MSRPVLSHRCVYAQNNACVRVCTQEAPDYAKEDKLGQEIAGGRENFPSPGQPIFPSPAK